MGGNVRKWIEGEVFYICVILSGIIKDDSSNNEFDEVTKQYDFSKKSSIVESGMNYITLLESWQDLQSYKINVIVSACKFSIADQKKDAYIFLKDGIPKDLAKELQSLEIIISGINRKYSTGDLEPRKVRDLTKL